MCKKGGAREAKWAQIPWWGLQSGSSALASLWVALLAQDHPVGIQGGKWFEAGILQLDSGQPLFCFCRNGSKTFFKQTESISCEHYFEVLSGVLHLALSFGRCVGPRLCRWQAVLLAFFLPPTLSWHFCFWSIGLMEADFARVMCKTLKSGFILAPSPWEVLVQFSRQFFFKIDLCLFYV